MPKNEDKLDLILDRLGAVDQKIESVNTNLNQKLEGFNSSLNQKMDKLNTELSERIDANSQKMDKLNTELSERIDANSQKMDKLNTDLSERIDANSQKMDKLNTDLSERIDNVNDNLSRGLDNSVNYMLNGGLVENLKQVFVTREEFNQRMDKMVTILDSHTKILERLDQERLFTFERVKRLEDEVQKIKAHLHIS